MRSHEPSRAAATWTTIGSVHGHGLMRGSTMVSSSCRWWREDGRVSSGIPGYRRLRLVPACASWRYLWTGGRRSLQPRIPVFEQQAYPAFSGDLP